MNFDEVLDRIGTNCIKWDGVADEFDSDSDKNAAKKAIPMWIADMDFKVPQEVTEALVKVADRDVYGYTYTDESFSATLQSWLKRRHGWSIEKEWVNFSPSVLPGVAACIRTMTNPGDKIILQTPVYYPFYRIISSHERVILENPLIEENMNYLMDFDDLEEKAKDPDAKLMILCSPHNPIGRVWTKDELKRVCDICLRNHVAIISDEIHSDLIMPGQNHTPLGAADERILEHCAMFFAPSKTFNLAGLQTAAAVIPNAALRSAFEQEMQKNCLLHGTPFGLTAFETAYTVGDQYVDELCNYIWENFSFAKEYFAEHAPLIRVAPLQGTYLMWLDLSGCGIPAEQTEHFVLYDAKIVPDAGDIFGTTYAGYIRLNIACPRTVLQKACEQLANAVRCYHNAS